MQGVSELAMNVYEHGGINMTGFQLVDFTNTTAKRFFELWSVLDPVSWEGAGGMKISVSWLE